GVRGFGCVLRDRAQNLFEHPLRVPHNIVIPESQNQITHGFQDSGSIRITFSCFVVLTAIKLHDELGVRTKEVHDKAINLRLPLELPSSQSTIAQPKPQKTLRVRLVSAQSPRGLRIPSRHPAPLTPALSPRGRGSTSCSWLATGLGRRPSK